MKAYYPSLLRLTLWTPFSTPVGPCRRHTRYGSNKLHVRNSVRLLYFAHWVTMNCVFQNGSLEWNFRMEVHSRVEFQNGSAFQSGISEWKCIPEWNIYVELNGPYGLP